MTATAAATGRAATMGAVTTNRRRLLAGLAPFLLIAVGIGAARLIGADGGTSPAERDAVVRYQEAVHPITVEWGKIEILGMRPAIGDLREEGGVPAETIAGEARHWQATLATLREQLAAVEAPLPLRRAAALFDESIVLYIDAARNFERAASSTGDAQVRGIEDGIAKVREGTQRFNQAAVQLQDARRQVGLAPTDDFPKEPASGEGTG